MRSRLVILVALTACATDDGLQVEGRPGTAVAARFSALLPYVTATVLGQPERLLLCDTGSPVTVLDASRYPGLPLGEQAVDLAALGLTFRDLRATASDLPDDDVGSGLLGANLLGRFAFTLDYQGSRLWLTRPYDAGARPAGVDTLPETALAVEVRGETRVLVRLTLEGQPAPVWAMVDSGASGVVLDAELFASLPATGRPRLEGVVVGTVAGPRPAFLSRVYRARLDGVDGAGSVSVDDVPVIVVPAANLLALISAEVGRDVRALVGGHLLRPHLATIDVPARRLRLAPYRDRAFIDPDEFVGVGLSYVRDGEDWRVFEAYSNRDAYKQGVRPDAILEEIDGLPLRGLDGEAVDAALARFHLGDRVPLKVRDVGGARTVSVLVEDLLPHYTSRQG